MRQAVADVLASRLFATEAAIDVALREAALLMAALPAARAGARLSPVTGQSAFDDVADSVGALSAARGHIVGAHVSLAAIARKLGLDDLAVGPLDKPEDTPPLGGGPRRNLARVEP